MCPDESAMSNTTSLDKLKDLGWKEIAIRWVFSQGVSAVLLFAIGAFIWFRYPEMIKEQEAEKSRVLKQHEEERDRMRMDAKEERKQTREDMKASFGELKDAIEKLRI